jgi:hypothetical protein
MFKKTLDDFVTSVIQARAVEALHSYTEADYKYIGMALMLYRNALESYEEYLKAFYFAATSGNKIDLVPCQDAPAFIVHAPTHIVSMHRLHAAGGRDLLSLLRDKETK